MRILLVTDAWAPQVNGVVRTLETTREHLRRMGHEVEVLSPEGQRTMPCPGYPEIRLTLRPGKRLRELMRTRRFDAVHIATEGPIGLAARRWCLRHGLAFTTSYHTRFPEYLQMRAPVPLAWSYAYLRWFHRPAANTLVRTDTQRRLLEDHGFTHLSVWPGSVDTRLFRPQDSQVLDLPRPIAMYVGRVAREKNLEAFLDLDVRGSKVIVGDGPDLERLRRAYPDAHFLGYRHGQALVDCLNCADVFVFPSRTETLGLVMLEAMACGVPVAAFPAPGPIDLITDGANGALDENLAAAYYRALSVDRTACVEFAEQFSWERSTRRFLRSLSPIDGEQTRRPSRVDSATGAYNPAPCESHPRARKAESIAQPS
ncbi:glycosyltransferase family 4 protein [Wenzhouxiangella marina]|uniref:Glycosyltransferase n=1 Tax=Wenzhouxiangella marina TaxID=1579979 RepID=A0A0K0XWU7_9GAMM|nr:glycosyltransferase family 1 protein [Wenzhouxiangella marina]AKS42107.1 Glycosyltransferase [Wenzhouxiangella marina]MBB6086123.1 glycosyltransferase involved in cell wall biosynthesis [Wenzhouxiangella marina]